MDDDPKVKETTGKVRPPARVVEEIVDENVSTEKPEPSPPDAEIVSKLKQASAEQEPSQKIPSSSIDQGAELSSDESSLLEEKPKRNIKLIVGVSVIVALFVILMGGGVYVYVTGTKKVEEQKQENIPAPTSTPVITQTPPPVPSLQVAPEKELSSYKIEVLNGSGLIGAASKVKDLIEKDGFKVAEVGNASSYDFEKTQIQVKKDVPQSVIDKLKEILTKNYTLEMGTNLENKSSFDIVITVGSK